MNRYHIGLSVLILMLVFSGASTRAFAYYVGPFQLWASQHGIPPSNSPPGTGICLSTANVNDRYCYYAGHADANYLPDGCTGHLPAFCQGWLDGRKGINNPP